VSVDLFGNPIADDAPVDVARERRRRKDRPKGYARAPGSGPAGEFCRTCMHAKRSPFHNAYWKCGLVKPTRGPGTDIRLKSPACSRWEWRDLRPGQQEKL